MKKCLYPFLPLLLGLIIAQAIATFHVFRSNVDLYQNLLILKDAGYLLVPNERIMGTLDEWGPAIRGGLFFTLSVGAGLSLLSLCAAWLYDRLVLRSPIVLLSYLIFWAFLMAVINWRGFSWINTAYFILIPPVVFAASLRKPESEPKRGAWRAPLAGICSVAALATLWSTQMDRHLFSDIRDYLLLSNPVGMRVNDFYYRYTLYPAEAFKSLDQKLLKSCRLAESNNSVESRGITLQLISRDYLPVQTPKPVDLTIQQLGGSVIFKRGGRDIHKAPIEEFLAIPGSILREVSAKSDRNAFFRQFTFFSLLIAFPLTLYVSVYFSSCVIMALFVSYRRASIVATVLCFSAGLGALLYLDWSRSIQIEKTEIRPALASECWQTRVAALKMMEEEGWELTKIQDYGRLLASPHISERVWAVNALGVSRNPESFTHLVSLTNDAHPNVVSAAFSALGRRGDKRAIPMIIRRIKTSHHWYSQWHAYKALKVLGWKQNRSS